MPGDRPAFQQRWRGCRRPSEWLPAALWNWVKGWLISSKFLLNLSGSVRMGRAPGVHIWGLGSQPGTGGTICWCNAWWIFLSSVFGEKMSAMVLLIRTCASWLLSVKSECGVTHDLRHSWQLKRGPLFTRPPRWLRSRSFCHRCGKHAEGSFTHKSNRAVTRLPVAIFWSVFYGKGAVRLRVRFSLRMMASFWKCTKWDSHDCGFKMVVATEHVNIFYILL